MIKSVGKTPYEIRLDLLVLARDILMSQHAAQGAATASRHMDGIPVAVKTFPSSEDIIKEAEKLNGFISKANESRPDYDPLHKFKQSQ